MFFRKNKKILKQCPACEWQPDGKIHWSCSCGHRWNTFKTKGKCPKCKTKWENTRCPGCGKSSPHKNWYFTEADIAKKEAKEDKVLKSRKLSLEKRLIAYGITNRRISDLHYLDISREKFRQPYEAGCRLLILYAISYSSHHLDDRLKIMEWLKKEGIWAFVSPTEKAFLSSTNIEEWDLSDLSWYIEGALVLGWCLGKVDKLPPLDQANNDKAITDFAARIPQLGGETSFFLKSLKFRDFWEIYEENLLNEMATAYFRDLLFNGQRDNTKINRFISYERHHTLNWLRTFMDINEWDETNTST